MTADERARLQHLRDNRVVTEREYEILELRYGRNLSQYQTADYLGLSRSTIRSTERNALRKIHLHERQAA